MGLSLLQIWLLVCITSCAFSSQIIRVIDGDIVLPKTCDKSCRKYGATCSVKNKIGCCTQCKCSGVGKTFYKKNSTQSCVVANDVEGCKYHLAPRTREWIKFGSKKKDLMLYHRALKLFSYKCSLLKQQYWNLKKWKDFERKKDIIELVKKTDYKIKLPKKNISFYEGHLIKLQISCVSKVDKEDSCIIFKILGKRKYDASTVQPIVITTKAPTTTKVPKPKKTQKSILIIIIIAVTVVILLAIAIFVICWCWKKRRKSGQHGEKELLNYGEDPNYQNTDRFSVRHSTEIHNSANNLTYLQPVDAGVPYSNKSSLPKDKNGKHKKKDHNYDYPDINNLSKKSAGYQLPQDDISTEKPIYAEVGDIKPNPEYTNPDTFIKPRSGTEVVGVPGYQPPRGPFTEDSKSTYSSLGVLSDDSSIYQALLDTNGSEKTKPDPNPPSPQYAVVEAEESQAVENTDEEESGDIII